MSRLLDGNRAESKKLRRWLKEVNKPEKMYGEGASDTKGRYRALLDKGAAQSSL